MKKLTTNNFILRLKKVHGEKYDYSKVNYTKSKDKIIIICPNHGEFLQQAGSHLLGCGCPSCGGTLQSNTNKFIENSKKVHKNEYDYSKVNYTNNHTNVEIICKKHGSFLQRPNNHITNKHGCPLCYGKIKSNIENFIKKSNIIHKNRFNYSQFIYINNNIKGNIICKIHGKFQQDANHHLQGNGCPKCSNTVLSNTKEFINKSKKIYGDLYDYSKVNYITALKKIEIICKKHGPFWQTPNNHLRGNQCPKCKKQISKPEMEFLDYLKIPNTKQNRQKKILTFKVDGIDYIVNTIYEFLGDYYHGNPQIFDRDKYNQICHKTFGELYENTFKKFDILKSLGYTIKYIWESDWKKWKKTKYKKIPIIKY